jgi:hypothetical protein
MHGRDEECIKIVFRKPGSKKPLRTLGTDERIILK